MHILLPAIKIMNGHDTAEEIDEESHEMEDNRADNTDMMDDDVPVMIMDEVDDEAPALRR